jgi:transposase
VSPEIVTDCLAFIDALAPVNERLDGELRRHARADPRVKVLTAPPGVGQFTALVMLAGIGDITRFGSARKLASWAGLTPAARGSDLTAAVAAWVSARWPPRGTAPAHQRGCARAH